MYFEWFIKLPSSSVTKPFCYSKVIIFFLPVILKIPGKKGFGPAGWTVQSKIEIYLWLGLNRQRKDYLSGLPNGFEENKLSKGPGMPCSPPIGLTYMSKTVNQFNIPHVNIFTVSNEDFPSKMRCLTSSFQISWCLILFQIPDPLCFIDTNEIAAIVFEITF